VLFSSCWAANAAVFDALATLAEQAGRPLTVFSDRLNHASIIDAIRAQRDAVAHLVRYDRADLKGLQQQLAARAQDTVPVIVTDGVFSLEADQTP